MSGVVVDVYRNSKHGLLQDSEIARLAVEEQMITPFHSDGSVSHTISYGLSSCGYDAILANEFRVFTGRDKTVVIDPKQFNSEAYIEHVGDECIVPAHGFALARTFEYYKIPDDVLAICMGKSTYARCGLIVNVTPLEPGWEGHVTLELSNTTPLPIKVYAHEGICQFLFFRTADKCMSTYQDKGGKYHKQVGITNPRMKS